MAAVTEAAVEMAAEAVATEALVHRCGQAKLHATLRPQQTKGPVDSSKS